MLTTSCCASECVDGAAGPCAVINGGGEVRCANGTWTPCTVTACEPGAERAPDTDAQGHAFCTLCPLGTFKRGTSAGPCVPCENKPRFARYSGIGESGRVCEYECVDGAAWSGCWTTRLRYLLYGCVVLAVATALCVAGACARCNAVVRRAHAVRADAAYTKST